jgi:precorrin-2/cobalt-factor-2 C20-methyltransferase
VRKTSLYLTDRLKRTLAERAAATGRSEADLVRGALEAQLADQDWAIAARPRPSEPPVGGRLVGVGVGPGDAGLVTIAALAAIRRADRVIAPSTAPDAVGRAEMIVRQAAPDVRVERHPFAMAPTRAARDESIAQAATTIAAHLDRGDEVAWITLGDPLTYSTYPSVARAVQTRRPATVVAHVPGIMAFQALAARTATTLADEHQRVLIRTALADEDITAELARPTPHTTTVIYKGGRRLPELARTAAAVAQADHAVAGELLGMPGERVGPLAALAEAGPASYLATVIIPATATPEGSA